MGKLTWVIDEVDRLTDRLRELEDRLSNMERGGDERTDVVGFEIDVTYDEDEDEDVTPAP